MSVNIEERLDKLRMLDEKRLDLISEISSLALWESGSVFDLNAELKEVLSQIKEEYDILREELSFEEIEEAILLYRSESAINEHDYFYKHPGQGKKKDVFVYMDYSPNYKAAFYNDPYIIVQDKIEGPNNTQNLVRVSLKDGRLLNHRNVGRRHDIGHLPENSNQLKELPKIMKSKYDDKRTVEEFIHDYLDENYGHNADYKRIDKFADFDSYKEERPKELLRKYNK